MAVKCNFAIKAFHSCRILSTLISFKLGLSQLNSCKLVNHLFDQLNLVAIIGHFTGVVNIIITVHWQERAIHL